MIYLTNLWHLMLELAPWLFAGTAVASLLHVWLPKHYLSERLGGKGMGQVFRAVAFGVPLPLCSCGVIPAAMSLKKEGASDGSTVGFLISTPQTGVDSVMVTASMLGWPFAMFKVVAALVTGLIGGFLVDQVKSDKSSTGHALGKLHDHQNVTVSWREAFRYGLDELIYPIWRWLVIGVLISATVTTWIPQDQFANLTAGGIWTLLLMVVISIPLYVCATASVPVAATLVASGFPEGAALVFLMAGPATNVATIGAAYRVFGTRIMTVYLFTVFVGSIGFGLLFDVFWALEASNMTMEHGHDSLLVTGSAVVLTALLIWYGMQDLHQLIRPKGASDGQETVALTVSGMTCGGCVKTLTSSLQSVDGVERVDVVLDTGRTEIYGVRLDRGALEHAVHKVGFSL
jgi:hypothetical protein